MSPLILNLLILCSTSLFHVISSTSTDIHDLLPEYGFPKGLIPNNAISYTISTDGFFTIQLDSPCYVHFSDQYLVYFHTRLTGKLSYGSVTRVSGIQAQILFLWPSVTGIKVHKDSGMLEFFAGALSQKLPAEEFVNVPGCSPKACQGGSTATNLVDRV
ncbi:uncharacterized protein LOC130712029 [Lotus japonicus]|uniref:uncharacterized protein LOC130712029 n=1 Tax=Lotus japonicus TaxID=34305 RepID=UPI00258DBF3D|nr:uncharacterized protein LOC130712029 [Lotus japonicus]